MLEDAAAAYLVLAPLIGTLALGVVAVRWLAGSRPAPVHVDRRHCGPAAAVPEGCPPGEATL